MVVAKKHPFCVTALCFSILCAAGVKNKHIESLVVDFFYQLLKMFTLLSLAIFSKSTPELFDLSNSSSFPDFFKLN